MNYSTKAFFDHHTQQAKGFETSDGVMHKTHDEAAAWCARFDDQRIQEHDNPALAPSQPPPSGEEENAA